MNSTNRGLNRLFIFLVGLLLLVAGAAAILLAALPQVAGRWRTVAAQLVRDPQPWVAEPAVGAASVLVVGVIVLSVVLILLLVRFIAKQGRGRSAAALQQRAGATTTRIDLAVPRGLLQEHLERRPELAGVRITAYEVRSTPMLKITARCRRGISPSVVADLIGRAVEDLETIVGTDVPAFVQLTGGHRAGGATRPRVA